MAYYDVILFDVDGTLIHSRPGIVHCFAYAFQQMGLDPQGIDLSRYLGPPLRWSFAQHFSDPKDVEKAVELYRARYAEQGMHECTLFPGVISMLQRLREQGLLLATATSKPRDVVLPILEEKGLLPLFDRVGGASMDQSVDTKTAVIRQVLSDPLFAGKRVLMVGDRQDDMKGAADCGLPAVGVLYGYGSKEELEPWHPVFLAGDCEELTGFILKNHTMGMGDNTQL